MTLLTGRERTDGTLAGRYEKSSMNKSNARCGVSLQVMSDLHLELLGSYLDFKIPRKAPYLLLGGDIGRLNQYERFAAFLKHQCHIFERVYLILGNHEYYGLDRTHALEHAANLCADAGMQGRLAILNRTRIDISDRVSLLGCTLHSQIPDEAREIVKQKVADFRKIEGWTIERHNYEHEGDLQWLKREVEIISRETPSRQIVIATHHAPSYYNTSDPRYASNLWNSAFATDVIDEKVSKWIGKENVRYWVFGHTHWCSEFKMQGIQLLSNQRGYTLRIPEVEKPRWSLFKIIASLRKKPIKAGFDVEKCITVS